MKHSNKFLITMMISLFSTSGFTISSGLIKKIIKGSRCIETRFENGEQRTVDGFTCIKASKKRVTSLFNQQTLFSGKACKVNVEREYIANGDYISYRAQLLNINDSTVITTMSEFSNDGDFFICENYFNRQSVVFDCPRGYQGTSGRYLFGELASGSNDQFNSITTYEAERSAFGPLGVFSTGRESIKVGKECK
jgi:hypothetical protein